MKTKRLLPILTMAAMVASCSQEEFIMPENANENLVENGFSQYVGVPFEGEVSFSKGDDAETRMGLTESLNYKFVDGDKVGLVWLNSDAISTAISNYDVMKESEEIKNDLITRKIVYANAAGQSNPDTKWDAEYTYNEYNNLFRTGSQTPVKSSYVWTSWPGNTWKIFSNTRMTFEEASNNWHMTDGQIFKGLYIAYYPYNQAIQSTQKFRVEQLAKQDQQTANPSDENYGYASHILKDMVWVSQEPGQKYNEGSANRQDATFVYALTDNYKNDVEQPYAVNIKMRPFSNILDTRIYITEDDKVSEIDAAKIKIESVELRAMKGGVLAEAFPTKGAFQFGSWGKSIDDFGVYGEAYDRTEPKLYTWNTKVSTDNKYVGEDLVNTITTNIMDPAPNNGKEQRVQLMLLPGDKKTTYEKDQFEYVLRINTDYGYIDVPEYDHWFRAADTSQGVVINPAEGEASGTKLITSTDLGNTMSEMMTMIGVRKTRGVNVKASELIFNDRKVCTIDQLMDEMRKWNELSYKNNTFNVYANGCDYITLDNFVWTSGESVSLTPTELDLKNQPNGEAIEYTENRSLNEKAYADIIKTFINNGNRLEFKSPVKLEGSCGINIERNALTGKSQNINFTNGLTIAANATLLLTGYQDFNMTSALTTEADSKLYVANTNGINLNIQKASTLSGETYVYEQSQLTMTAPLSNYGKFYLNGKLASAKNFKNAVTGDLYIYAKANADGKLTNEGEIYYANVADKFTKDNYDSEGEGVIATIDKTNKSELGSQYLEKANAFGATILNIDGTDLNSNEWVNNTDLTSFKKVNLNNVAINVFNDIKFSSATINVKGKVTITGYTDGAARSFTASTFNLAENAILNVVADGTNDISIKVTVKPTMASGTTIKGYNYFSTAAQEPTYTGAGSHKVLNANGDPMTWN